MRVIKRVIKIQTVQLLSISGKCQRQSTNGLVCMILKLRLEAIAVAGLLLLQKQITMGANSVSPEHKSNVVV